MSRLSTTNTEVPGLESDRITRKYLPCADARSFQHEIILVMVLFEYDGWSDRKQIDSGFRDALSATGMFSTDQTHDRLGIISSANEKQLSRSGRSRRFTKGPPCELPHALRQLGG